MRREITLPLFLFAIFACSAAGAAEDGSEIRLYGRGDFDITREQRNDSTVTKSDLWKGSRIGLKGRGYLGSGLTALFHVESGFGTKDGRFVLFQDKVFGRQAYLGLETAAGTVTFGRQYPVSDAVTSIIDIALPGVLSPYKSQFYWQIDRLEKALMYSTPKLAGFQGRMGYAFGEKAGAPGSSTLSCGLLYSGRGAEAGLSLDSWRTSLFGEGSATYNFWNLAVSYDLKWAVLSAGFSSDDVNMDLSSTTVVSSRTYAFGSAFPLGSHGAGGRLIILLQRVQPDRGRGHQITTLRYEHVLFKGMDLYAQINLANKGAADAYGVKSEVMLGARYLFNVHL